MLTDTDATAEATLLDDAGSDDSLPSGEGFEELAELADSMELGDDTSDASADTPLPGDAASLEDSGASEEESDAADETDPADESEGEPEGGGDGKGEAEGGAAEKHGSKNARFEHHFSNAQKPIAEIDAYLETKDPARYALLQRHMLDKRTEDPVAFGAELYERDPERFGRVATAFYSGHPEYYARALVGDADATPEQIQQAWAAFKSNPGGTTHAGGDEETGDAEVPSLSDEEMEELRYWDAEVATKVEQLMKAKPAPEAVKPAEEPKKTEEPKPDPEAVAAEERAQEEALTAGYTEVINFLNSKADDPVELGLAVTDAEREKAPALAEAKDYKRELLFHGKRGALPDFETGLYEWAKGSDAFNEAIKAWGDAARAKDKAASVAAARRIQPFAEKYLDVRLKHDLFARADKLIRAAAADAKRRPAPPEPPTTPGTTSRDSQRGKGAAEQSLIDVALEMDV